MNFLMSFATQEKIKTKRIEVKNLEEIELKDLYPLGRLTVYTEKAIKEIGEKKQ